uniref:Uncharacterized protein n=1 Tax=Helicotheca tamesis TaxID=374047 RepID=A0A7S2E428_9STRA
MAFGLTSAAVTEFASQAFIRNAVTKPRSPISVLSFFYGVDYEDPMSPSILKKGSFANDMGKFWFGGHEDYDKLCKPFSPVIREAGRYELVGDNWQACIDGNMAQLILTDQLSRNAFRGSDEAFQYDGVALSIARELFEVALSSSSPSSSGNVALEGELYGPYASNIVIALMHSESLLDHDKCLEMVDWGNAECPGMNEFLSYQRIAALEHKEVIERFGRYPHRNTKMGRENTPEETKWLASDDVPGWAKSQV